MAASLGFLPAMVAIVETDNSLMQFVADAALGIDAYKRAAIEYRVSLTEGTIGEPVPAFPANPSLAPPSAGPAGLYQRLDDLVKRIRVAPNYTPETGALLGIVSQSPARPAPVRAAADGEGGSAARIDGQSHLQTRILGRRRHRDKGGQRRVVVRGRTIP